MLVQFKSPATETITMFDGDAVQLLKLMGATGRVPGGLSEQDVVISNPGERLAEGILVTVAAPAPPASK